VEILLPVGTPGPHTPRITTLLPNPTVAGEVWAGVEVGGVLASADRGRTWQAASDGLPSLDVHSLAWASGSVLLAALPVGVAMWRSARWHPCVFEPVDRYCRALAVRADDPGVIYCGFGDGPPGTRGGVARSADGGRTWQVVGPLDGAESAVWAMATSRSAAALVLAAAFSGRVFVSRDGGGRWDAVLRTAAPVRAAAALDA
jgi:hypothetical protein